MAGQTEKIGQALRRLVRGPVRADDKTLDRYATDQSMYQIRPLVVVFPQDLEDVVAVARPVLMHRVITSFGAESEGINSPQIVQRLVDELEKEG